MTEDEYLAHDLAHEGKHEFYNGEVVLMAGSSEAHALVTANVSRALGNALEGRPCRVYTSDLRVSISETGAYVYPDVTVVCGKSDLRPTVPPSLLNPSLVVEVLSGNNEAHDRGAKAAHYRRLRALRAYALVDIDARRVEVYYRGDDETWRLAEVQGNDGDVAVAPLALSFPVVHCWRDLDQLHEGAAPGAVPE